MKVTLDSISPNADRGMVAKARVSSSRKDKEADPDRLLAYCVRHKHWSIFETANMVLTIETSRAVSAQILRHRSFTFQEFSQRYATATDFEPVELRKQGETNRQVGDEVFDPELVGFIWKSVDLETGTPVQVATKAKASEVIEDLVGTLEQAYEALIEAGVARECARMVLPLCTRTTLHMNGTIRSWIHYLEQRTSEHTQKEHRLVALEAQKIFIQQLPLTSKALGWA